MVGNVKAWGMVNSARFAGQRQLETLLGEDLITLAKAIQPLEPRRGELLRGSFAMVVDDFIEVLSALTPKTLMSPQQKVTCLKVFHNHGQAVPEVTQQVMLALAKPAFRHDPVLWRFQLDVASGLFQQAYHGQRRPKWRQSESPPLLKPAMKRVIQQLSTHQLRLKRTLGRETYTHVVKHCQDMVRRLSETKQGSAKPGELTIQERDGLLKSLTSLLD